MLVADYTAQARQTIRAVTVFSRFSTWFKVGYGTKMASLYVVEKFKGKY